MKKPPYWNAACKALADADPVMKTLIKAYPEMALASRGDAFGTLARSIVGQQISVKAADSVWQRLMNIVPDFSPQSVLASDENALRQAGLSQRKVSYLHDLARHFSGNLLAPAHFQAMSDEEIIAALTAVRGIGVWSAQMFLIFHALRPNVFPIDDLGLQKAIALHYYEGAKPDQKTLKTYAQKWNPWCSVATWYLWRSLDPVQVVY